MPPPDDLHEWMSFEDVEEDRTWVFDVTFLTSPWTCIFGRGCQGVLTAPTPERQHGCCSYGAHFTGPEDIAHTQRMAARLTDEQWQHKAVAAERGTILEQTDDGDTITAIVDDACIFLNRPGFEGGAGCALHRAAMDAGDPHLEWKPTVCWQLPLRLEETTDDAGHVTSTLREWKRRDWGEGGFEFGWWCTDDPEAFVGRKPVYKELRDEIVAMVGPWAYDAVVKQLKRRERSVPKGTEVFLPHPAIRRKG